MSELNFDATNVDPADSFDPIPTGWYPVTITESVTKPTADSSNDNSYLELIMSVAEGDYASRKLFARLNLNNQNPVAVEIAQRQLSSICHAVGVMQVRKSEQLHAIPLMAKVVFIDAVKDSDTGVEKYAAKNDVKGFKAIDGSAPAVSGAADASNVPDWVKEGTPTPESAPAIPDPANAVAAPPAVPAPAAAEPVPVMTAKANGVPYEEYIKQNWTDALLVEHGFMEAAAPAPPAAPSAPAAPGDSGKPPWAQ